MREQRALAGAVQAEHADLRAGEERQPDVLEDDVVGLVNLAQPLHGVDELRHESQHVTAGSASRLSAQVVRRASTGTAGFGGSGVKSSPGLMKRSVSKLVLLVVERAVAAAEREQLGVRAALDDLAVLEHEDLIGAADRRQPVRDDERRPAAGAASAGRPGSAPRSRCRGVEVASSRTRIRGSARIARAIATRWRWPPDSLHAALADDRVVALLERRR